MFQANYKDIRMALTETVLLSLFFEDFGQVFVSWVIFKKVIRPIYVYTSVHTEIHLWNMPFFSAT